MGFLGFLKKNKDAGKKGGPSFDMPPLHPKMDSGREELPSFADDKILDELKLPDIDDLNQPNKTPPEMPPPKPFAAPKGMDGVPKPKSEMPDKKAFKGKPKDKTKLGEMGKKPDFKIGPGLRKRPQLFGKKSEKAPGPDKMMPEGKGGYSPTGFDHKSDSDPLIYGEHKIVLKDGDVFIKGDDYRDVLEALDSIIARRKEAEEKVERDRAAEKFYNQFEVIVEKLQKKLATAEIVIFEQKR